MSDVYLLFKAILNASEKAKNKLFNWIYTLINFNLERNKMMANPYIVSSNGFILNVLYMLLKYLDDKNGLFNLHLLTEIPELSPNFTLTTNKINFPKFDRINPENIKEYVESETENANGTSFSANTVIYYSIHILLNYVLKNIDEQYKKIAQEINIYIAARNFMDPKL